MSLRGVSETLLRVAGLDASSRVAPRNFPVPPTLALVGISDILYFFRLGGGRGNTRRHGGGGVGFLIENPTRGGGVSGEGGRGKGAGRVSAGKSGGGCA